MQRQAIKDILEAIGFVAIIASLVFVGIETRHGAIQTEQNTRALQISAYQDLIDNISELNRLTLENPEVAALMYKAFKTEDELTELESFRLSRAFFMRLRHGDMAYVQFERGAINEEQLRSVLSPLNITHPRVQVFWNLAQDNFAQAYRDYMNQLIEESNAEQ